MQPLYHCLISGLIALAASPTLAALCDVDNDNDVDNVDIEQIIASRNEQAGPGDPRDADADGTITLADARICITQCSLPECASPVAEPLVFGKQFLADTIGPGSTTILQFEIANDSLATATDLNFTDVLPASMSIATPANAATTCQAGDVVAPAGGATVTLSDGQLAAGEACTVRVNVSGNVVGVHTSTSGDLTSSGGNSGAAEAVLTVDGGLPGFRKAFTPAQISPGATSVLTFTVDNTNNPSSLALVSFTDTFPTGLVIATPSNLTTDCGLPEANTIVAEPGANQLSVRASGFGVQPAVAAFAACTLQVDVTTSSAGVFGNVSSDLESRSSTSAVFASSGFAAAELDVQVEFLNKSFTNDPVVPGAPVTLEFTLVNLDRDRPVTAIGFTDPIDPLDGLTGLTPVEALPKPVCAGMLAFSGSALIVTGASLPAGGSCSFSVQLLVPVTATAGTYTNTTDAVTATIDGSGFVGNAASDTLVVGFAPVLTQSFIGAPVGPGSDVTLRFSIVNPSPDFGLTDLEFTEELTPFLPFPISATLPVDPCGAGSSVVFTFPATERMGIGLVNGTLAAAGLPGDTCTFDVVVTVPAGLAAGANTYVTSEITATGDGKKVRGLPASADLTVLGAPTLRKEFTDNPVEPGDSSTLVFAISMGESGGNASDIGFTDDLGALNPALSGLTASGLPKTDLCGPGNGVLSASPDATLLTFSGASLASRDICVFDVEISVPVGAAPGSYVNTSAPIEATNDGVAVVGNAAEDTLIIGGLGLDKAFARDTVIPGSTVLLSFTIDNPTQFSATGIRFTDTLSPDVINGLAPTGTFPVNNVCGARSTLTWNGRRLDLVAGSLPPAAACTFDVDLAVPAATPAGNYVNRTTPLQGILGTSGLILFNAASAQFTVNAELLTLDKAFDPDSAAPGGATTLSFALANTSETESITEISFTDRISPIGSLIGLTPTAGSLPAPVCGGTLTLIDSELQLTNASLGAGELCVFDVALNVPFAGTTGLHSNVTSPVTGLVDENVVFGAAASASLAVGIDSDGDGIIDLLDPDDDNDGVGDARDPDPNDPDVDGDGIDDGLDPDPVFSNNACSGDSATFDAVVTTNVVCGAKSSINVGPTTEVRSPDAVLKLIAPRVEFDSEVKANDTLIIISKDPCESCD